MGQGRLAHALSALSEGDDVDEPQGTDERIEIGAGVLAPTGGDFCIGTPQDRGHVTAPDIVQLTRQEVHEAVDAVEGHQPRRGVVQAETFTEVGHEGLQLPQDQAVHRVGLGSQELEHAGRGQG